MFLPDMFLGQHVARRTGRHIDIWMGECHVHAAISPVELREQDCRAPPLGAVYSPRVRLHDERVSGWLTMAISLRNAPICCPHPGW